MAQDKDLKTPNIPPLRFPDFTDEWKKVTLGEIGIGFNYGLNAPAKEYDGMNKYIRITDIEESTGAYSEADIVSPNGKLSDEYIVNNNDILLARTGASTGKSYLYAPKDGRLYFAGFLIRFNVNKANPYFIYTNLHTRNYWRWVNIMSARSGQPGINSQEYSSYPLYIPSRKEQNKIANLLQLLDERIATQNKIIEDLKKLKSAIIDGHFNGLKANCRIGELITEISQRNRRQESLPVLSVSNRSGFIAQSEQFGNRTIASEDTSNYKIVITNDFAFNPARINVGSIARLINYEKGIVSPMYICFRCKDGISSEYLDLFFKSRYFQTEVGKRLEGSVRQCLSIDGIKSIQIERIPMSQQMKWAKRLTTIESKLTIEENIDQLYKLQRKYLLSKMFI